MIELIQVPWSPFCIVQRRILEFSGTPFKLVNIPTGDRSLVWRLTRQRYYQVPILHEGRNVLFETDENSQVIAKYLDDRLQLGLFPKGWDGVQTLLWEYIESEVEGAGFRLNDIYWKEFVPKTDQLSFLRFKERKFGRGCIAQWHSKQSELLAELERKLAPFEQMLVDKPYLLEAQPRFVDFDLFGILANFLYSGHYQIPAAHTRLTAWHQRMKKLRVPSSARQKSRTLK